MSPKSCDPTAVEVQAERESQAASLKDEEVVLNLCDCCAEAVTLSRAALSSSKESRGGWLSETEREKAYTANAKLPPLPLAFREENNFIYFQVRWGPNHDLVHELGAARGHSRQFVPEDMTSQCLEDMYEDCEAECMRSEPSRYLENAVRFRTQGKGMRVSKCIILGSGSPSVSSSDSDAVSALFQIAILKSIADLIEDLTGTRPQCYAQDPAYTDFDAQFLADMGITEVIHPQGFELIDKETFVFSPGIDMKLERQVMHAGPGLWLHRPTCHYRPDAEEMDFIRKGEALPFRLACLYMLGQIPLACGPKDIVRSLRQEYEAEGSVWPARITQKVEVGTQMTRDFEESHTWVRIPCNCQREADGSRNDDCLRLWSIKADESEDAGNFQEAFESSEYYSEAEDGYESVDVVEDGSEEDSESEEADESSSEEDFAREDAVENSSESATNDGSWCGDSD